MPYWVLLSEWNGDPADCPEEDQIIFEERGFLSPPRLQWFEGDYVVSVKSGPFGTWQAARAECFRLAAAALT